MSAIFEQNRPEIIVNNLVVAKPVGAREWKAAAFLNNYVYGKGKCLVPANCPNQLHDDASYTYRFYVGPSQAKQRLWTFGFRAFSSQTIEVQVNGGPTYEIAIGPGLTHGFVVEDCSSITTLKTSSEELSVVIGGKGDGTYFIVESISCHAFDLAVVEALDGIEFGADITAFSPNSPILSGSTNFAPIIANVENLESQIVKPSLIQLAYPDGIVKTSGNLFRFSMPVLGSKTNVDNESAYAVWRFYGSIASGSIGNIQVTTTNSSVSDTLPVTWYGGDAWSLPRVIEIDPEDLSTTNGLVSAAFDDLNASYTSSPSGITTKAFSVYQVPSSSILDLESSEATFARSGVAWRQISGATNGSTAFLESMGSNIIRVNDDGTSRGKMVLLETTAYTNLFTHSENLVSPNWSFVNITATKPGTILAPDATTDGTQFVITATAGAYAYQTITGTSNNQLYRLSFWARMSAGSGNIRAFLQQRDGTTLVASANNSIGTAWKKVEVVLSVGSGANNPLIGIQNGSDAAAKTIYIWGAQLVLETGTSRGNSYVETTTTTASSNKDSLWFEDTKFPASFRDKGFSFVHCPFRSSAEMVAAQSTGFNILCGFSESASDYVVLRCTGGVVQLQVVSGGFVLSNTTGITFSAGEQIGIEILPSQGIVRAFTQANGRVEGTGTPWTFPTGRMYIGARYSFSELGSGGLYSRYWVAE